MWNQMLGVFAAKKPDARATSNKLPLGKALFFIRFKVASEHTTNPTAFAVRNEICLDVMSLNVTFLKYKITFFISILHPVLSMRQLSRVLPGSYSFHYSEALFS